MWRSKKGCVAGGVVEISQNRESVGGGWWGGGAGVIRVVQVRRCMGSRPSCLAPWPPSSPPCRCARPHRSPGRHSARTIAPGSSHGSPLQDRGGTVSLREMATVENICIRGGEGSKKRKSANRKEGRKKVLLAFGGGVSERVLIDSLERERESHTFLFIPPFLII